MSCGLWHPLFQSVVSVQVWEQDMRSGPPPLLAAATLLRVALILHQALGRMATHAQQYNILDPNIKDVLSCAHAFVYSVFHLPSTLPYRMITQRSRCPPLERPPPSPLLLASTGGTQIVVHDQERRPLTMSHSLPFV